MFGNPRQRVSPPVLAVGLAISLVSGLAASSPIYGQPAAATESFPRAKLDRLLRNLPSAKATVGACVMDASTGKVLYGRNPDELMIPASNLKVLIAYAALSRLGADFSFATVLARYKDDIVIIGGGDPALGDPVLADEKGETVTALLEHWAKVIAKHRPEGIKGDLIVEDMVFGRSGHHPSWPADQLQTWYAAPSGGLNFHDNCIDVTVFPSSKPGGPAGYEIMPPNDYVRIDNRMQTGTSNTPTITRIGNEPRYRLTGKVSQHCTLVSVAVPDPGMLFASAFRKQLEAHGVKIAGEVKRAKISGPNNVYDKFFRPTDVAKTPLADCLKRLLRDSQNLFGDCLLKVMGYMDSAAAGDAITVGTWETGGRAVVDRLRTDRVPTDGLRIADGSGLSRDNRVTARVMTRVLHLAYVHPDRALIFDNLARGGGSNTLKGRLADLGERVRVKTGYINKVRTLSGYVQTDGGRWLAFSVLFNDIPGPTRPYNKIHDEFARTLAAWGKAE